MNRQFITEIWRYHELLYFFAWRDIKVRYRQAALGAAWALIQPLMNMIIFTLLFGRIAHMPSNGIPYPIFCYCALVPWTYFSTVLGLASVSLTSNSSLIEKVYFPRVLLPAGAALAGLLDFIVGSALLVVMMFYYHVHITWLLILSPLIVIMTVLLTVGLSMFAAAVNVRYRDVKYVLPFLIQIWMYATPIVYPMSLIPAKYRPILALNPCWGIIEAFRASILPNFPIDLSLLATSLGVAVAAFIFGAYYFERTQKSFADVI